MPWHLAWRVNTQHAKIITKNVYLKTTVFDIFGHINYLENKIEFVGVSISFALCGSDFDSLCGFVRCVLTSLLTLRLYLFITSIFLGFLYAGHLQWCLRIWLSGNIHWCLWASQM